MYNQQSRQVARFCHVYTSHQKKLDSSISSLLYPSCKCIQQLFSSPSVQTTFDICCFPFMLDLCSRFYPWSTRVGRFLSPLQRALVVAGSRQNLIQKAADLVVALTKKSLLILEKQVYTQRLQQRLFIQCTDYRLHSAKVIL